MRLTLLLMVCLSHTVCFSQEFELSQQKLTGLYVGQIKWADLDSDEDLDIIYFGAKHEVNGGFTFVYENVDGEFVQILSTGLPDFRNGDFALADYDNDNDLDILVSGLYNEEEYISRLYINNGNLTFSFSQSFMGLINSSVEWVDVDNDSDLDFVLTGTTDGETDFVQHALLYENMGANSFSLLEESGLPPCTQCGMDWADYNGDGFQDVVITGFSVNMEGLSGVYRNNGNRTFSRDTSVNPPGLYNGSALWGDFDNDNDLDFLINGVEQGEDWSNIYRFFVYENNGESWIHREDIIIPPVTDSWLGSVKWSDIDSDGYLDILVAGRGGSDIGPDNIFKLFHNTHGEGFTEILHPNFGSIYCNSLDVADYDEDGDKDIVFMGLNNTGATAGIYNNVIRAPVNTNVEIVTPIRVKLTWQDLSHEESNYRIFRSLNEHTGYEEIASLPSNTSSYHDDFNFDVDAYYYYTIRAEKQSRVSSFDSAKVLIPAAPDSLTAVSVNAITVNLFWHDNSQFESAYVIEKKLHGEPNYVAVANVPPNTEYCQITGLAEGTIYDFRVRAKIIYGYSASALASIKTNTRPTSSDFQISSDEDQIFFLPSEKFAEVFSGNDDHESLQRIIISTLPSKGKLSINGVWVSVGDRIAWSDIDKLGYSPNENLFGTDFFTYRPHDGRDSSNITSKISIAIAPVNDPPVLSVIGDIEVEDYQEEILVPFTVTDVDNSMGTISVTASSSNNDVVNNSELSISGSGGSKLLRIQPEGKHLGTSMITISASDGNLTTTEEFAFTMLVILATDYNTRHPLTVLPNPTVQYLQFSSPERLSYPIAIRITDISGRPIMSANILSNDEQVNVAHLAPGLYTIEAVDQHGRTFFKRFIRQ